MQKALRFVSGNFLPLGGWFRSWPNWVDWTVGCCWLREVESRLQMVRSVDGPTG